MLKAYRITVIENRGKEQPYPAKSSGVYEYPESMNVRKFWLGLCRRKGWKLYSVEPV